MTEILIATTNMGKQRELQSILDAVEVKITTPKTVSAVAELEVEETGTTLAQNAELKAVAFGDTAQMITIADDSGLMVDALDGQPGVYSHRFAPGSDADRCRKLLDVMQMKSNRAAQFQSVLCLYNPTTKEKHFFTGEIKGEITYVMTGKDGFGYDPVFQPEGFTQTFASLGLEVKNKLSHRGQALAKLLTFLQENPNFF